MVQQRQEIGESDGPMEDDLEEAFDRTVAEGVQRLHRPWRGVLVTGFFGGTEVALGLLALVAVVQATGEPLLGGLAFSIGFLALLLGHSELFTEGFLVPITAVAAKRASWKQLGKLWSGTLVANLAGGWLIMWLIVTGFPEFEVTIIETAAHFAQAPLSMKTFSLAVLGGATITLMTRMQHGTDSMPAKIVAAIARRVLAGRTADVPLHPGFAPYLRGTAHRRRPVRIRRLAGLVRVHHSGQCRGRPLARDAVTARPQQRPARDGARRGTPRARPSAVTEESAPRWAGPSPMCSG